MPINVGKEYIFKVISVLSTIKNMITIFKKLLHLRQSIPYIAQSQQHKRKTRPVASQVAVGQRINAASRAISHSDATMQFTVRSFNTLVLLTTFLLCLNPR